ncbi:MAG: MATE family efflux transporter [Bacteroidetes bacterium]|nr:MATE family efflux transporter [Bacteroidota bacterium]
MADAAIQDDLKVEISNKQIFKIALPISVAILIPQLNFITNNIFLGHYSTEALAIASITGVYYLIFAAIGFGMNNGLQTLISRRAGENRPEEIGKIFTQGVYMSLGIAAVGLVLTYFVTPLIFRLVIHDSDNAEKAISFLRIRIWGLPFLYVYQLRNALLVGTNQSRYLIMGTLAEAIANVVFDYLLIFGKFGFPEMGFNGAALASIIAEFTGMFVIFLVIHQKGITRRFALFKSLKWDAENASLITSLSAPLVFQHGVSIISWEFFYILIERNNSETALAISNTMRNVFGLFGSYTWAFAAAASSMVSNIIGQGRQDEVQQLIWKIVKISTGISIIVFVILNVFPQLLLSIYGQPEEFIREAIPVVRVISVAMLLMSFSVIWISSVTGTGNTKVSLMIEVMTIIFYCLFVFIVLEKLKLGIVYGWMSEWLYWTSLFIPSLIYIRSGRWRKKVI